MCFRVILDDLGTERKTSAAQGCVHEIINERIMSGKPMIITTNLTPSVMRSFTDIETRRIYDRIAQWCIPIFFDNDNFRTLEAAKNMRIAKQILGL